MCFMCFFFFIGIITVYNFYGISTIYGKNAKAFKLLGIAPEFIVQVPLLAASYESRLENM